MEWLILLGLVVVAMPPLALAWVWRLTSRVHALEARIAEMERRARVTAVAAPLDRMATAPSTLRVEPTATEKREPLVLDEPIPADEREPLLLTNVVPPDELVLDTPLPAASNDQNGAAAVTQAPPPEPPIVIPAAARPLPRASRRRVNFEKWLAENGLAWFGGGAIALGLILLVAFAAGQSWFTAPVRLVCAFIAGAALLVTSEWVRRNGNNTLVAALLAGAAATAFYAVAWAAHGVYHFIDWPTAAALLTLCALMLLGLSQLHGQPLGVLAIAAALLAPAFASAPIWPSLALMLYVAFVASAGFAVAWIRRWAWATAATITGLYFWFAASIAADDVWRAVTLISFASLGGAATWRRAPLEGAADDTSWARVHEAMPTIAIVISSTLLMWTWLWVARSPALSLAGPTLAALGHVALAGLAVRARAVHPLALVIAIAGLCLGFIFFLIAREPTEVLDHGFFAWILFAPIVVAITALAARPHHTGRKRIAGAGAVGTALLYVLAAFSREMWASPSTWGPLFIGAVILWTCALLAARDAPAPQNDLAVDLWSGAAAALFLVGIESAFPAAWRAAADAGTAVLAGAAIWRRNWRAMRLAAPLAAVLALGRAFSSDLFGAAASGQLPLWIALSILGLSAALLLSASRFAVRDRTTSEGLSTASLLVLVIGVFLLLRWMALGHNGAPLDRFSEDALRTLALMAAGHVVLPLANETTGRIGAWRAHLLLGAGALYALYAPALLTNPWWGEFPAQITGPIVFNALLLGLAAPAAFLFYAAARLYRERRTFARIYAALGGALLLTWLVTETRHIFHAGAMATAPLGLFEASCYGLILIGVAFVVAVIGRLRTAHDAARPFSHDLTLIARGCAWSSLVTAVLLMLAARHPWWGGQDAKTTGDVSTGLAVAAQAATAALSLALGRALSRGPGVDRTRFAAAAAAALFAWSFGHCAIRWLYHGGAMDDGAGNAGLEGFAHALWPLAFVLGASAITVRAPNRDTIRPYLYDLQSIWSVAIWPAMVFACLGLWELYAPWWGVHPVQADGPASAVFGVAAALAAGWMSFNAVRVPRLRWPDALGPLMRIACAGHILFALALIVRWSFHASDMNTVAMAQGLELWTYSAVFALFGGGMIAFGATRNDGVLSRIGLFVMFVAALKVIVIDTAQLNGLLRVASFIGVGVVAMTVAWTTRRIGQRPKSAGPDVNVTPAARREGRHGRR